MKLSDQSRVAYLVTARDARKRELSDLGETWRFDVRVMDGRNDSFVLSDARVCDAIRAFIRDRLADIEAELTALGVDVTA